MYTTQLMTFNVHFCHNNALQAGDDEEGKNIRGFNKILVSHSYFSVYETAITSYCFISDCLDLKEDI
jgi:hypothetical protein